MSEEQKEWSREKIEEVATKVETLFMFAMQLDDGESIEILKETMKGSGRRASIAMAAAPLLTASGMDYEEHRLEADLRYKRAKALIALIEVLKETEDERVEFKKKQADKAIARQELGRMLGL